MKLKNILIAVEDIEKSKAFYKELFGLAAVSYTHLPAKKAVLRARELVKRGADTIAFASCIQKGTPIGYPCPFSKKMKDLIKNDLGDSVKLLDYTH